MKFTEGYWLPSEKAHPVYATQAYEIEKIPGGMRVLATTKKIANRGETLNLPTITIEFVAHAEDTVSVEAWHYEAYDENVPSFEKQEEIYENVNVEITEEEALLDTGKVQVRVRRKDFSYTMEADGKVLTGSGFRNLGYMRWGRKESTMFPETNYLHEEMEPYMVS